MRQRGRVAFMAWLGCSLLLLAVYWRPQTAPLDADEVYWIGSAYYYDLAFAQRDWHHPDWRLLPARENPPVAKYIIGLSLALAGERVSSPDMLGTFFALYQAVPGAWGKGSDYEKRAQIVARMETNLYQQVRSGATINLPLTTLVPARCAMLGCVVIASFLALLFGRAMGSWLAGLVASQLLLVHPAVVFAYNHAASDPVALMFSTGAALLAIGLIRAFALPPPMRLQRAAMLSLLAGTLLALACGAKMNSLIVLFATTAAMATSAAILFWRREPWHAAKLLALSGAMVAYACLVFIGLNPAILTDLSGGLKACVVEHRLTEQVQAGFLSGHLTTLARKFDTVAALAFFGRLGCGVAAALAIWWLGKGKNLVLKFVAAWWIIGFVCVTVWIPFAALRYIMPLIVPSALLIGWTLHAGLSFFHQRAGANTACTPPASAPS
jgi:hypothetical protein